MSTTVKIYGDLRVVKDSDNDLAWVDIYWGDRKIASCNEEVNPIRFMYESKWYLPVQKPHLMKLANFLYKCEQNDVKPYIKDFEKSKLAEALS